MRSPFKKFFSTSVLLLLLCWGLISCGDRLEATNFPQSKTDSSPVVSGKLSEVAPPKLIAQLNQTLDQYNPQITLISPQADQVVQDTTVEVKLQVQDFPIFKNTDLEMGPHLHLILDNEPYQAIYDISKPVRLEHLSPGTHTLRVFAVRPWHESFKNNGAYAQTTFHVFSKNGDNAPQSNQPLLTYSRPKGEYGAEPILLDFYLTNAPLHIIAQENPEDEISDWRILVTINGESFLLDRWQPLYLKGFNPGENWVQLEFIDEKGNKVDNFFNNTVRVITYTPNGQDTLSKLVRGELSPEVARTLVNPNYKAKLIPPVEPEPEAVDIPEITEPEAVDIPEITETPEPEAVEIPEPQRPQWFQNFADKFGQFKNRFQSEKQPALAPDRKIIPVTPEPAPTTQIVIPEVELPEGFQETEPEIVIPEVEIPERLQEEVSPKRPATPKFI